MNIKTIKILKKYANMMIPGSKKLEDVYIELFESLSKKTQKQTLEEIKMFILMHNN